MADTDYLRELAEGGTDIGHEHVVKTYQRKDVEAAGLFIVHPSAGQNHIPAGEPCAGSTPFDLPVNHEDGHAVWQLHSLDPLHIEPSVLCSCGDHGFIRDGRWVPA